MGLYLDEIFTTRDCLTCLTQSTTMTGVEIGFVGHGWNGIGGEVLNVRAFDEVNLNWGEGHG